jgi:hypothetical protein
MLFSLSAPNLHLNQVLGNGRLQRWPYAIRRCIPSVGQGACLTLRPSRGSIHAFFNRDPGPELRLAQPKVPKSSHLEHTEAAGSTAASVSDRELNATSHLTRRTKGQNAYHALAGAAIISPDP